MMKRIITLAVSAAISFQAYSAAVPRSSGADAPGAGNYV